MTLTELLQMCDTSGGPETCWPWLRGCSPSGYGRLWQSGKLHRAHRMVFSLACGDIPEGLCVLHRCDNPPCCNPDHLWLGTHAQNMKDRDVKGRQVTVSGDMNGARLHPEKMVRGDAHHARRHPEKLMRGESHVGAKLREIALAFGVSKSVVSMICRRELWDHVV